MNNVTGLQNFDWDNNPIISYIKNENTASKTYTLPPRDGNIALEEYDVVSITGGISLSSTAFGKLHLCTGTSANYTVVLPTAVGNTGKIIGFKFSSALTKLVTLDGLTTETIEGETTKVYWAKESVEVVSNGTNWEILSYKFMAMTAGLAIASVSIPQNSDTKVLFDAITHDNTGLMADTTNHQVNILRKSQYNMQFAVREVTTTAVTAMYGVIRVDAANVTLNGNSYGGNTSGRNDQHNGWGRPVEINAGSNVDLMFNQSSAALNFLFRLNVTELAS